MSGTDRMKAFADKLRYSPPGETRDAAKERALLREEAQRRLREIESAQLR